MSSIEPATVSQLRSDDPVAGSTACGSSSIGETFDVHRDDLVKCDSKPGQIR